MADIPERSEAKTATEEPSEAGAALLSPHAVAQSHVVVRRILERGQRRARGAHLSLDGAADAPTQHGADGALPVDQAAPASLPTPEEFLALFHEYERYVTSIGNRILGANNGVDDLVQDVFLVIYQEFHKLRELSSIKAWLATIATRMAWRQRGRPWLYSKLSLNQVEELNPLESTEASPELQADLATLLERLRSMPPALREPWLLRFIDGETLPRIAELCDCSQSTVQRRLRDAAEVMLGQKP